MHWPAGFASRGQTRSQFHHLIDVVPTILDAARIPAPAFMHGIQQMPLHGVSMRYFFDDPGAPNGGRRSTSRSCATAVSTTRAGRR